MNPTITTYRSKHQKMPHRPGQNGGPSKSKYNENSSNPYTNNYISASGVSLPNFTQFSQTMIDDDSYMGFEEEEYYRQNGAKSRDSRSRHVNGIPHSLTSNKFQQCLENGSVISEDYGQSRYSRTSYSNNSRMHNNRSRSSI